MNVWAMVGWPEIFKQVGVLLPLKFTTIYTSFIQVKCLVCLFLMFTSAAGWANLLLATKTAGATELKLLVYNTHGLPAIFAGDKPNERFPKDLVLQFAALPWKPRTDTDEPTVLPAALKITKLQKCT